MNKNLLNQRELQILILLSQNFTNKQIACKINLSIHTVKAHNTNIYRKLNAKKRTEAVVNGIKLGYLKLI